MALSMRIWVRKEILWGLKRWDRLGGVVVSRRRWRWDCQCGWGSSSRWSRCCRCKKVINCRVLALSRLFRRRKAVRFGYGWVCFWILGSRIEFQSYWWCIHCGRDRFEAKGQYVPQCRKWYVEPILVQLGCPFLEWLHDSQEWHSHRQSIWGRVETARCLGFRGRDCRWCELMIGIRPWKRSAEREWL